MNNNPVLYPSQVVLPATASDSSWLAVSTGTNHSCGIIASVNSTPDKPMGSIWCWGGNREGQSGQDTSVTEILSPTKINAAENWVAVSAGFFHTCAVKSSKRLFCWGRNANVQLGPQGNDSVFVPTQVGDNTAKSWISVVSGRSHDCAVKQTLNNEDKNQSDVWCWGRNLHGQLGNGTINLTTVPNKIINNKAVNDNANVWSTLETGGHHSCAIKTDGSLWCWGLNTSGQIGNNNTVNNTIMKREARLYTDWLAVSSYANNSCGLRPVADNVGNKIGNSLWCWGDNFAGQLGNDFVTTTSPAKPLISIPTREASMKIDWDKLSVGDGYSCAIKQDSSYWCWGDNSLGKLGRPPSDLTRPRNDELRQPVVVNTAADAKNNIMSKWQFVSAGRNAQCGIALITNNLYCWGDNTDEQLGSASVIQNGEKYSAIPLQVNPVGITNSVWFSVGMGKRHACAIALDKSLWCWGNTINGAIGDRAVYDPLVATVVAPLQVNTPENINAGIITRWKLISVHDNMSCAIKVDNTLWCWGANNNGETGSGTKELSPEPVQEASLSTNWKTVSASDNHTCALKLDNSLWCWGDNGDGELGNGNVFVTSPVQTVFP